MSDAESRRYREDDWLDRLDRHQSKTIDPIRALQGQYLDHAVSYGQMTLRSALLLNGGALVALPAFAEVVDSIRGTGHDPTVRRDRVLSSRPRTRGRVNCVRVLRLHRRTTHFAP